MRSVESERKPTSGFDDIVLYAPITRKYLVKLTRYPITMMFYVIPTENSIAAL